MGGQADPVCEASYGARSPIHGQVITDGFASYIGALEKYGGAVVCRGSISGAFTQ